jgi:hypothetical protein
MIVLMSVRSQIMSALVALVLLAVAGVALAKGPTGPDPVIQKWNAWPHPVTCSVLKFNPIVAFGGPTGAERGQGGPEQALRRFLREPGWGWIPKRHWRSLGRNSNVAEFVQGRVSSRGEREMSWLGFFKQKGKWKWGGSGGCIPRTVRSGVSAAQWDLYDEKTPPPDTETLVVGIEEIACHGFQDSLERLQTPEVRYTPTAALITFWVRPIEGGATCPAPPPSRYELNLPGPLGDRKLYDAGTYPPRPIKPG